MPGNSASKIKGIWLGLISLTMFLWAAAARAVGESSSPPAGTGTQPPSTTLTDPLGVGGISGLFDKIINGLLLLAGPIAVLMIIYAGYLFIIASDNEDRVKTARRTILWAVVGIAVLVMSKAIIYVVLDFLKG